MPKALLRELTHEEVLHLESHRDLSSHPWPKGVETISPEAKALIDDLHPWPVSNEEAWAIAEIHLEATRRKTLRRGFNEEELRDLKRSGIKEHAVESPAGAASQERDGGSSTEEELRDMRRRGFHSSAFLILLDEVTRILKSKTFPSRGKMAQVRRILSRSSLIK